MATSISTITTGRKVLVCLSPNRRIRGSVNYIFFFIYCGPAGVIIDHGQYAAIPADSIGRVSIDWFLLLGTGRSVLVIGSPK